VTDAVDSIACSDGPMSSGFSQPTRARDGEDDWPSNLRFIEAVSDDECVIGSPPSAMHDGTVGATDPLPQCKGHGIVGLQAAGMNHVRWYAYVVVAAVLLRVSLAQGMHTWAGADHAGTWSSSWGSPPLLNHSG
jgi:hypothetical protein